MVETTSEEGIMQAGRSFEDQSWRELLQEQNRNMLQLIQAIKSPETQNLSLPEFNPEQPHIDARAWCATVGLCLDEHPLQGGALIIALSKALRGSASSWISQVSYKDMTWESFKELFLARYDSNETLAATLINFQYSNPRENESLATYSSRLMSTLDSRLKDVAKDELIVALVLAHIEKFDTRVKRLAFTTPISSRLALQQELKVFTTMKRKSTDDSVNSPDSKRPKTGATCYICGQFGHKASICGSKKQNTSGARKTSTQIMNGRTKEIKKTITCFRCGNPGHISSQCKSVPASGLGYGDNGGSERSTFSSGSTGSGVPAKAEHRRVNKCNVEPIVGVLNQSGEQYSFCYDSGAECSLIK